MALESHERMDQEPASREVFVTFSPTIVRYSAQMVRSAGLDTDSRVTLYVDEEARRLGFRFHRDRSERNSYCLTWPAGVNGKRRSYGVSSAILSVVKRHDWVRAVAERTSPRDRRFRPRFDGKLWVVELDSAHEQE